ncbi:MAG: NADH-quinone oxidoreductase subunit J [Actinomycetota bacterium]
MAADLIVFWVFAPISVASAIAVLIQRNAVHAALFLIVNFFTIAVFFLLLGSPFLFVVQIVVYAGAIMVLFLFVIMLLGVDQRESLVENLKGQRWLAVALAAGVTAEIFFAVRLGVGLSERAPAGFDRVNEGGNPAALGRVLFRDYFFPFEVTSILLIVAAIAAMVLTRRRVAAANEGRREDQAG